MKRTKFNYYRKFVNNLTIKQVAAAMNCSESLINHYDSGSRNMRDVSYRQLEKFSKLFHCRIEDLFDE